MPTAKYLELMYQGYFMCRSATAPDPANERRGMSGYTMALASEDPLDQMLRLQECDYVRRNYRSPSEIMNIHVGVKVCRVLFDGHEFGPAMATLEGARVELCGRGGRDYPTFDCRNHIVGASDAMKFAINPFHLRIAGPDVLIEAEDHLDPRDPDRPIWRIDDPRAYARRLPVQFKRVSAEVCKAIGVFDFHAYFRDRRRWLRDEMAVIGARMSSSASGGRLEQLRVLRQGLQSRLYQLDLWGERVTQKLGVKVSWRFHNNGAQRVTGDLGGEAMLDQPWLMRFWLGGWDGDLLIGYMRGCVGIPFIPAGKTLPGRRPVTR